MKFLKPLRLELVLFGCICLGTTQGQWTDLPNMRLVGSGLVNVGTNVAFMGPSLFQVNGNDMSTLGAVGLGTQQTMRLISHEAKQNMTSYWRGVNPANEIGQIFTSGALPSGAPNNRADFNVHAKAGFLRLHTTGVNRFQLNNTRLVEINSAFGQVNTDGYLGLSNNPNFFGSERGPFSRLHLADDGTDQSVFGQWVSYRPWMRNGITLTGNKDQAYIGLLYGNLDQTDLVFQWSDNHPGQPFGTDRLRFLFTGGYDSDATGGGHSMQGLEAMRMVPQNYSEVNIGVGDFAAENEDPTDRLDLINGRLRIRELPTDDEAPSDFNHVLVVDAADPASDEYGVVKWRSINTLGADTCAWTENGGDIATAYVDNPGCPQEDNQVSIGMPTPQDAKLGVWGLPNAISSSVISALTNGGSGNVTGIAATASPVIGQSPAEAYRAVSAMSKNATGFNFGIAAAGIVEIGMTTGSNRGVTSEVIVQGSATENIAIRGIATVATGGDVVDNIAVYASASGGNNNNWAHWANGSTYNSGSNWTSSDAQLKRNIEPLNDALRMILELQPKSYYFNHELHPGFNLPEQRQLGLIAQEVERVLPSLVLDAHQPDEIDKDGKVTLKGFDLKVMNYTGLIPVLIGAVQEQQSILESKQTQIDALNERLSALEKKFTGTTAPGAIDDTKARLEQNAPNPFNENTTIRYYIPHGTQRSSIQVMDGQGKEWKTFGSLGTGSGQLVISAGALPTGSYTYALFIDGEKVATRSMVITQ